MTSFLKVSAKPRIAVRAVIVQDNRLLLVNAWPGDQSDLWCAPGGGVEMGSSMPDNLAREVFEETGLRINVGAPCLVNEFHDPDRPFHQVEVFFRATVVSGELDAGWIDPEDIVNKRGFFDRADLAQLRVKPAALERVAFEGGFEYDSLERLVR